MEGPRGHGDEDALVLDEPAGDRFHLGQGVIRHSGVHGEMRVLDRSEDGVVLDAQRVGRGRAVVRPDDDDRRFVALGTLVVALRGVAHISS